jgi:predicted ATP-grasp superfamily ATP-dependent carboligase
MDIIAIIGVPWNSHELDPAVCAARELGVRLCVADTAAGLAKIPHSLPCDRLEVPEMTQDHLSAALAGTGPRCVVSITEMKLELAARVREIIGIPGTASQVERTVSDKLLTRTALSDAGLTAVRYWCVPVTRVAGLLGEVPLPVVVKPRTLAGSNGVRLLDGPADVPDALSQYRHQPAGVLVESYLPGVEISVEALAVDGRLFPLTLTDKVNTGSPYFQEIGHIMPSRHTAGRGEQVTSYLQQVITALGIGTAPIHAELKLSDHGVDLVEIHTRFGGGNIVRLLRESRGIDAFKAYFAALLSGRPPLAATPDAVWGVGFFTSRAGGEFEWRSFDIPHPAAVVQIDLDRRRRPKLREFRGVRIRYWRAGHAMFRSAHYHEVHDNISAMTTRFRH